jgi:hypothetical protein
MSENYGACEPDLGVRGRMQRFRLQGGGHRSLCLLSMTSEQYAGLAVPTFRQNSAGSAPQPKIKCSDGRRMDG